MKKRPTEQQIIGFQKEAEAGMPVKKLCREHGARVALDGAQTKPEPAVAPWC